MPNPSPASPRELDRLWIYFSPLFFVLLAADQLSKLWALNNVDNEIRDFGFVLSYNDGIVFGIDLPQSLLWLLLTAVFAFAGYLVYEYKLWRDRWHLTALAFLFAGAIGNIIDRIRFGYVIDFIQVYWWPTFNLADAFIVIAVGLFFIEFLFREKGVSEI